MSVKPQHRQWLLSIFISGVLIGCTQESAPPSMPPPEVSVMTVEIRDIPREFEYVGQVAGFRDVEVRARATGILQKRAFTEGRAVKKGDVLFVIEPESMQAALAQAQASLALEQARLTRAQQEFARIEPLLKDEAVSPREYDEARATLDSAKASTAAAQARVREAHIQMNYTRVVAPISGLTSKEAVSEGSLVSGAGQGSLLTVISQVDPVYVNFSMADNDALKLRRMLQDGELQLPEGQQQFDVELKLADGSYFGQIGRMNFTDNMIDPSTGTIRARAQFANPHAELLPGQFVRVVMKGALQKNAISIPQRAVLSTAQGQMVWVVNADSKAEPRILQLGEEIGRDFLVQSGLQAGDRVIIDGTMKARPNAPVKVVAPTTTPAAQQS